MPELLWVFHSSNHSVRINICPVNCCLTHSAFVKVTAKWASFFFPELHFTFLEGKTEALFISESPWPVELSKLLLVVLWIALFILCQQPYCAHLISFNWQICCKIFCFSGLLFCIGPYLFQIRAKYQRLTHYQHLEGSHSAKSQERKRWGFSRVELETNRKGWLF